MSMIDRLLRPLRTGIVTSRYPAEAPVLALATRQLPTLDAYHCTRDGACVTACPTGAISLTAETWTVDAGRCVFCGACARVCPTDAIRLDGGVTLAATTPAGLLHATPLMPRGAAMEPGLAGTSGGSPAPSGARAPAADARETRA
jgi:formate hydrogenlyase subunit 6/NADH:ubiquinone oxidoreductase subunit I